MASSPVSARASRTRITAFLRHTIATLILIMLSSGMSLGPVKQAHSAEQSHAPNMIIILTDDKYWRLDANTISCRESWLIAGYWR